jgi:hypothetical protein
LLCSARTLSPWIEARKLFLGQRGAQSYFPRQPHGDWITRVLTDFGESLAEWRFRGLLNALDAMLGRCNDSRRLQNDCATGQPNRPPLSVLESARFHRVNSD